MLICLKKTGMPLVVSGLLLTAAVCPPAAAAEAPLLSSPLAAGLRGECRMYLEEGRDVKALRACEELRIWARENNEPAVVQEMDVVLDQLRARQPPAAVPTPAELTVIDPVSGDPVLALQPDRAACGYESMAAMPPDLVQQVVTDTPVAFLTCRQDEDCMVAKSFCGTNKAIRKSSRACFEAAVVYIDMRANCIQANPRAAAAACLNGICTLQFKY